MRLRALFITALLALPGHAPAIETAVLEKDMAELMSWMEGRFDNSLEVFWQEEKGIPAEQRNYRRHSIFRRVDLPAFGPHVIYAEQYRDGDPEKIYRQRLYVFSVDSDRDAIRLRVHIPPDTDAIRGAYRDPALLEELTPDSTKTWPGCDVFWKKNAGQYRGSLDVGACRFNSERYGQVLLEEELTLSRDELWFADRGTNLDGTYLFGMKGDYPAQLRRIRPFECWAAILKGAEHGDDGLDKDEWWFQRGVWLHDQQGDALLRTDESPPRDIHLKLRRVEWPSGNNRPSLTLYVHEGDSDRATSYAWTEYDGERIGLNLRWIQASCTHAPERIFSDGR